MTKEDMAKIVPADHIYINTNEEYVDLVKEQLPEVSADNILAEPIHRNTAPSMAWANHRISMMNPNACVIATPSDQAIFNEEAFRKNVLEGLAFVAENNHFLTMGVKPTRPEPGYGYIQMGDVLCDNIYQVQSFTEKPERDFAKKVAKAIKAAFPCKKVAQVVLGLEVPHAHIHLIPMNSEADVNFRKEHLKLSEEEFKEIADKIYAEFKKL